MQAGAVEIGEPGLHTRFQDIELAGGHRALGSAADTQSGFDTESLEREVGGLEPSDASAKPLVHTRVVRLAVGLQEGTHRTDGSRQSTAVGRACVAGEMACRVNSEKVAPDQRLGRVGSKSLQRETADLVSSRIVRRDENRGAGMAVRSGQLTADRALSRAFSADDERFPAGQGLTIGVCGTEDRPLQQTVLQVRFGIVAPEEQNTDRPCIRLHASPALLCCP